MRRDFRRISVIFKLQKREDIIYHRAVQAVKLDAKIFLPFCDFYSCTFITVLNWKLLLQNVNKDTTVHASGGSTTF